MQFTTNDITPEAIDVEYVRRGGFKSFIEVCWPQIDPEPFVGSWHIDEIANHLEAIYYGEIRNLIINIPPGMSKSSVTCVLWPLWIWIQDPRKKFICASYEPELALRDARRMRNTVDTDWFQARWPHVHLAGKDDSTAASRFYNDKMGFRVSVGVGQRITGWHGHYKIIDDPNKPLELEGVIAEPSKESLQKANVWYDNTFGSRNVDVKKVATLLIMQRLAHNDLTGHLLEKMREGTGERFEHLRLPMEYDSREPCVTAVGGDRRKEDGELLCPERIDAEALEILKLKLGSVRTQEAQLGQRPSARGGNIIKGHWLRHWGPCSAKGCRDRKCPGPVWDGDPPPPESEMRLEASWDLTFKKGTENDYVCGQVWGLVGGYTILLHQVRDRMSFTELLEAFQDVAKKYPRCYKKRVEKAANAEALRSMLHKKVAGIDLESPKGSKEDYLKAVTVLFESGHVIYPSPKLHPWVEEVNFHELMNFPSAKHDDSVDATTHELIHVVGGGLERLKAINDALRAGLMGR